jgi:hypothetical protein
MEVRRSELIAAISLASDLGMGHPLETGLGTAVVAVGLARRLGLEGADVDRVRDLALLQHVGCTSTATEAAEIVGDDLLLRSHAAMLDFADKRAMAAFMVQHVNRAYPPIASGTTRRTCTTSSASTRTGTAPVSRGGPPARRSRSAPGSLASP